jgi:hypothetical protein
MKYVDDTSVCYEVVICWNIFVIYVSGLYLLFVDTIHKFLKYWIHFSWKVNLAIYIYIYSSTVHLGSWCLFQFLGSIHSWKDSLDRGLARPTHRTTQTQNKRTQTSMSREGFKPMISVYEQWKAVHTLDRLGHCDQLMHERAHARAHTHARAQSFKWTSDITTWNTA